MAELLSGELECQVQTCERLDRCLNEKGPVLPVTMFPIGRSELMVNGVRERPRIRQKACRICTRARIAVLHSIQERTIVDWHILIAGIYPEKLRIQAAKVVWWDFIATGEHDVGVGTLEQRQAFREQYMSFTTEPVDQPALETALRDLGYWNPHQRLKGKT